MPFAGSGMRAGALLTLDVGSVLYTPDQMPAEVVLKHVDGEVIKAQRLGSGAWQISRRLESDVNFLETDEHPWAVSAVLQVIDEQAFGVRLDGEPVDPLVPAARDHEPAMLEVECLDCGGVLIEDDRHLPFAVYTTDEAYYRAYSSSRGAVVTDRRDGPGQPWLEIDRIEGAEGIHVVRSIAADSGLEAVEGTGSDLKQAIREVDPELYTVAMSERDETLRTRTGVQKKTAFDPTIPTPRPVGYPDDS